MIASEEFGSEIADDLKPARSNEGVSAQPAEQSPSLSLFPKIPGATSTNELELIEDELMMTERNNHQSTGSEAKRLNHAAEREGIESIDLDAVEEEELSQMTFQQKMSGSQTTTQHEKTFKKYF